MKIAKPYDKYTFLRLRAAQLYHQGKTEQAAKLLTYVDERQADRFFFSNLRRVLGMK